MNSVTKGIWVWTKKAEKLAEKKGLSERKEGEPATFGHEPLKQYAPTAWVNKGYIVERM